MKRTFRTLLLFVAPCLVLSACAGTKLNVPGDLSRPPGVAARAIGAPQVVVEDFSYKAAPEGVIGRDYDRVRPIVWKGEPGKAMADLVAAVLRENGVAAIRRGAGGQGGDAVPVTISGVVRRFEVNSRRTGIVELANESTISVTVTAAGPGLAGPSEQEVTSSTSLPDVFVTPDGIRESLTSTANTVAEEAVRRLLKAKVVTPSS